MPSKNKYKQNAISKLNYVNLNMKIFLILNIIEGNLQFNQKYIMLVHAIQGLRMKYTWSTILKIGIDKMKNMF